MEKQTKTMLLKWNLQHKTNKIHAWQMKNDWTEWISV